MLRTGRNFQFEVPDGWSEVREGTRWVYRASEGLELIMSSTTVDGNGTLAERQALEAQLLSNAMAAARSGATQAGLLNTLPLQRNEAITDVSCWTFISETPEKDVLFMGAVAATEGGVLFATLEAPGRAESIETFRAFLKTLRRPVN